MSILATNAALPAPSIHWSLDFGVGLPVDDARRLITLLAALRTHGRLGAAAIDAGISYRTAWTLLNACEQRFARTLVSKARGRGTQLSPFAERLLALHAEMDAALQVAQAPWQRRFADLLSDHAAPARLCIAASHDLALADWIENGRRVQIDIRWLGSEDALTALARGECDAAGFHFPETWDPAQTDAWLRRWLRRPNFVFCPVMRREHGLILAHGNPHHVRAASDIARLGLRIVNRQRGSGTRGMIDQLLAANGVAPATVRGYAHEEFTHDAVAAAVASGQADVGFGIRAAAARYDLDFVPLGADRYGLALRAALADAPAAREILRRFQGATFGARLAALPGYTRDTDAAGLQDWPQFCRGGTGA